MTARVTIRQIGAAAAVLTRRSPLWPQLKCWLVLRHPFGHGLNMARAGRADRGADWLLRQSGRRALSRRDVLHTLSTKINRNHEIELLLTATRKQLLLGDPQALSASEVRDFVGALIRQCLLNEYVFYASEAEQRAVEELLERVHDRSKRLPAAEAASAFLRLAMYRPPLRLVDGGRFTLSDLELTDNFRSFVQSSLDEARAQSEVVQRIESLHQIENDTSARVAAQYEEYPYPKWDHVIRPAASQMKRSLERYVPISTLMPSNGELQVLVAGCGTGERAVRTALGLGRQASVLGIDVSRASLAYGTRMAERWEVGSIRFMQLDILDVEQLECQFDLIECIGVLHHMGEPALGWRRLVERLKPGGFMHLHLYSKYARREIAEIRAAVGSDHVDQDYIRKFRYELMTSRPELIDRLAARNDFFDMLRCKDLLFNVSEYHFDIPDLARCMADLDLEFRGFATPEFVAGSAWTRYPNGRQRLDLDAWDRFERRHPDAFKANDGYSFWCRKPVG